MKKGDPIRIKFNLRQQLELYGYDMSNPNTDNLVKRYENTYATVRDIWQDPFDLYKWYVAIDGGMHIPINSCEELPSLDVQLLDDLYREYIDVIEGYKAGNEIHPDQDLINDIEKFLNINNDELQNTTPIGIQVTDTTESPV